MKFLDPTNVTQVIHKQKILDLTDDQSYVVIVADNITDVVSKFVTKYKRTPDTIYIIDGKPGTHLLPVTEEEVVKSHGKTVRFVTTKDKL